MTIISTTVNYIIDLPFAFSNGRVNTIRNDDPKFWRNKVLSVFSTGTNERVWYYDYGANLTSLLFEPSTAAIEDAKVAITQTFASWLPELKLVRIESGFDSAAGAISLSIYYQLPTGDVDSVKINNNSLTNSGETKAVN